jgi:hypothetical protein
MFFFITKRGVPNKSRGPSSVRVKPARSYNRMAELRNGVVLKNKRMHPEPAAQVSTCCKSAAAPMRLPRAEGNTAIPRMQADSPSFRIAATLPMTALSLVATQTGPSRIGARICSRLRVVAETPRQCKEPRIPRTNRAVLVQWLAHRPAQRDECPTELQLAFSSG